MTRRHRAVGVSKSVQRSVYLGAHPELLKTCPLYQRLHEAHFQRLVA